MKVIRRGNKLYTRRGDGIYLIGITNEFGEKKLYREPKLVKRIKSRSSSWGGSGGWDGSDSGWDSSGSWGSSDSGWGGQGGGLWDTSGGGLWDNDSLFDESKTGLEGDDMFTSPSTICNSSGLFDDVQNETVQSKTPGKEPVQEDAHKIYHPYKFAKEVSVPESINLNKVIHPWSVKLAGGEMEKLVFFQAEEKYILKEDIAPTVINALLNKSNIAPKELPDEFNKFLYHLANSYLVNITFTNFTNFITDFQSLKNMELEETDKEAVNKIEVLFKEMFEDKGYKAGDKLSVLLEKKLLLSNIEYMVEETTSFDTLDWVDIPSTSYLHDISKEAGGINYLKVNDKTYVVDNNRLRILHVEE